MDPVLFSLPEIILSDVEPDCTQSGPQSASHSSPRDLQPVREPDVHEPTDMDAPCERHLIFNLANPFQPRAEDCPPFLNVLPGVCPSSLGLQGSPKGDDGSYPELSTLFPELFGPCFPLDPCWPDMSPVTSTPNSNLELGPHGLVPHVLVPPHVLFPISCTCSPPQSWFILPEARPGWCMCPQAVPVHQPGGPDPVSRGKTAAAATGKEQLEEQAEPVGQRSRGDRKVSNNTVEGVTSALSPGSLPSLDEEAVAERNFKEYMTVINSLGPKAKEHGGEEDEDEEEKLTTGNIPFLEYMHELCSNGDFVTEVELKLNTKYLDPPLAPDPDPIDLLSYRELLLGLLNVIQQQLADLPAADSDSVTPGPEETAPLAASRVEEPAPAGSQSDTSPNQDGQKTPQRNTSPREGRTLGSPVLPSQTDASPSPLDHDGCLFKDYIASLQLLPQTSPAAGLTSASEARDAGASAETPAAAKPEEASTSLSNLGDTRSAQASQKPQESPLPGDPPASERPSTPGVSGANEDPRTAADEGPAPGFRDDLPAGPPAPSVPALTPPPMREPCSLGNINSNSRPEATPEPYNADSCDPPGGVVLSDPASSELRAGHRGETERKEVGEASKEERSTKKTSERKKENRDKKTKARRGQRPSSETENPKAMLRGEPITEGAEEKKACKKGEKKSERVVEAVYEKQTRRSSGRRQLFKDQTPRPEIGERERRRKPAEEMQRLEAEGEEQEVKDPDASGGTGSESAPTTEIPREEREFGEGAQMSGIARRTRSSTTAEREQPTPPPAVKTRGRGTRSKVEIQDDGTLEVKAREEEAGRQTLTVLSLMRRSRREKTSEDKASLAEPSTQSTEVQADTRSTKDSTKESSGEGRRLSAERKRGDVSGAETRDFYSLRSQSASRGTRATRRPANPAGDRIDGGEEEEEEEEEAGRRSLAESPKKRPKTSGCKWSPTSTGSRRKAKDGKASKAPDRREAPEGVAAGTRTRRGKDSGTRFPTRLSTKLPTKYQDFILCKANTRSRPLDEEERKTRRGRKR